MHGANLVHLALDRGLAIGMWGETKAPLADTYS